MRRTRHLSFVGVVILMLMALLMSCAPTTTEELPPIKIGALLDFTGACAEYGPMNELAMRYMLDQIGWEVAGRKVDLVVEDGAGEPATGLEKAKKMVEQDKVCAIIGPVMSNVAAAVASYLTPLGIPYLAIMEHSHTILESGRVFLPGGTLHEFPYVQGLYASGELGLKKAAVIYPDYVYGQEGVEGFEHGFAVGGGQIVQRFPTDIFCLDFGPYLGAIKEDVDCIYYSAFIGNIPVFLKQYQEYGLHQPLFFQKGASLPIALLTEAKDSALGMVTAETYCANIDTDANRKFVADFKAKFGILPEPIHVNAYVSISAVIEALKVTGGDTSPDKLAAAMSTVKVEAPQGTVQFTPSGMCTYSLFLEKVEKVDGEYRLVPIKEYDQVNRDIIIAKYGW